jgi:lipopolysaccharide export system protein LptA
VVGGRSSLVARRSSAAAVLALGLAVSPAAAAPRQQRAVPAQGIVLLADVMEGDWFALNLKLSGKPSITGPQMQMTADRITITGEKGGNRIASASAAGNVRLQSQEGPGVTVTATGTAATFQARDDRATLTGGVKLLFTSPKLAEPASLVGERMELALSTGLATVYRTSDAPVVVALQPKGQAGVALQADQVRADTRKGVFTATGKPVMKHPQGTLAAEKIWFELQEETNEVRVAHAEGGVRVHAAWKGGRTLEARAERARLLRAENRIVAEGSVAVTLNSPGLETPHRASGEMLEVNLTTSEMRLDRGPGGQAEIVVPYTPKPEKTEKGQPNANPDR